MFIKTRAIVVFSTAVQAGTGIVLMVSPSSFVRVVFGYALTDSGIAVSRLAGVGLLSLGMACWPGRNGISRSTVTALFTYNLLAAIYLGYLGVAACAVHAVLALLLVRPAYDGVSMGKRDSK
jgi:hypothetical protein